MFTLQISSGKSEIAGFGLLENTVINIDGIMHP